MSKARLAIEKANLQKREKIRKKINDGKLNYLL